MKGVSLVLAFGNYFWWRHLSKPRKQPLLFTSIRSKFPGAFSSGPACCCLETQQSRQDFFLKINHCLPPYTNPHCIRKLFLKVWHHLVMWPLKVYPKCTQIKFFCFFFCCSHNHIDIKVLQIFCWNYFISINEIFFFKLGQVEWCCSAQISVRII